MRTRCLQIIALTCALCGAASSTVGFWVGWPLEKLSRASDTIVGGRVVSVKDVGKRVHVEFRVALLLKGTARAGTTLRIDAPWNMIQDVKSVVDGVEIHAGPGVFKKDEQCILFLRTIDDADSKATHRLTKETDGKFFADFEKRRYRHALVSKSPWHPIQTMAQTIAADAATRVPQTAAELWADFPAMEAATPLETEVFKTWEQKGITIQLVRFTVGVFGGQKLKLAGFFAHPTGAKGIPGLVQCHGGGQRASVGGPLGWAQNGYATFCPNNGAQPWAKEFKDLPNTDWGTFNPGVRKPDKRDGAGRLAPGPGTVDKVVSPRNEPMYLRMVGMRRAITFLQSRPEVNRDTIGFRGHSTGGVMTARTMTDPRLKAAVPSMGGCGFWWESYPHVINNLRGTAGMDEAQQKLFLNTVACDAYWKTVTCPVLFLAAANDFNSATENVVRALAAVPHAEKRWAMPAHYNHSVSPAAGVADEMWFEAHLKGTFVFPETPEAGLTLKTDDNIPTLTVTPDPNSKLPVTRVDIYYSYGRQPQVRYWADGFAKRQGDKWVGKCPTFHADEPLFAYANVTYGINHDLKAPYVAKTKELLVTSNYSMASPEQLAAAGVKPTEKPRRLIDDFSRGLHDWVGQLDKASGWFMETRKLVDPRWIGPKGATLVIDAMSPAPGSWIGVNIRRRFKGQNNAEYRYYGYFQLPEKGWCTLRMTPDQFVNVYGEELDDWHKVMVLAFQDADWQKRDHQKHAGKGKGGGGVPSNVSGWDSKYYHSIAKEYAADITQSKSGTAGRFRNLRWEGGDYIQRPKHYEKD